MIHEKFTMFCFCDVRVELIGKIDRNIASQLRDIIGSCDERSTIKENIYVNWFRIFIIFSFVYLLNNHLI